MDIVRFAGRSLLASIFVVSGVKAVRNPDVHVAAAEPITEKLTPMIQKYAPEQVSAHVPDDTRSLVRLNGAVQVVGGLALATGIGRRLGAAALAGSLVPTTLAGHAFWNIKDDPESRRRHAISFLSNLSILGGLILAANDTEGQPSIRWRTQHGISAAKKSAEQAKKSAEKSAKRSLKAARRETKLARVTAAHEISRRTPAALRRS